MIMVAVDTSADPVKQKRKLCRKPLSRKNTARGYNLVAQRQVETKGRRVVTNTLC